jgi:hypothetical protein
MHRSRCGARVRRVARRRIAVTRIQIALGSALACLALAAPPALADAGERGGFVAAKHRDGTLAINPGARLRTAGYGSATM